MAAATSRRKHAESSDAAMAPMALASRVFDWPGCGALHMMPIAAVLMATAGCGERAGKRHDRPGVFRGTDQAEKKPVARLSAFARGAAVNDNHHRKTLAAAWPAIGSVLLDNGQASPASLFGRGADDLCGSSN
jgi:hypothetical protein